MSDMVRKVSALPHMSAWCKYGSEAVVSTHVTKTYQSLSLEGHNRHSQTKLFD